MDTELISRVRSCVWYLQAFATNGSSTTGGALCINKWGLLITAASVVKNAQVIHARPWEGKKRKVKMVAAVFERYGVALLWLERSRSRSSSPEEELFGCVDLKREAEIGVGEGVCTFITHQPRRPFSFYTGTMASLTSFPLVGEPLPSDLPLLEVHHLDVNSDSFGSPLFSVSTGDLLGIVVLERGDCNYVVPSNLLYHCVLQALQAPPQNVVRPSHVDNNDGLFRSDFTITPGQPPQL